MEQCALLLACCKFFAAVIPCVNACSESTRNVLASVPEKSGRKERAGLCFPC